MCETHVFQLARTAFLDSFNMAYTTIEYIILWVTGFYAFACYAIPIGGNRLWFHVNPIHQFRNVKDAMALSLCYVSFPGLCQFVRDERNGASSFVRPAQLPQIGMVTHETTTQMLLCLFFPLDRSENVGIKTRILKENTAQTKRERNIINIIIVNNGNKTNKSSHQFASDDKNMCFIAWKEEDEGGANGTISLSTWIGLIIIFHWASGTLWLERVERKKANQSSTA